MKWYIVACCLLWARHGEGGAIKCVPNPETDSCITDYPDSDRDKTSADPAPSSTEAECLAFTEWESHCYRCHCSRDGVAQCTRMAFCDSPTAEEPIRCKPNTTFARDCNTCACLENGLGLCTLRVCVPIPSTPAPAPSKQNLPQGSDCEPGSTWRSQCNDCVCSPEGLRFCTEKACPGQEKEPILRCAPHSLWRDECNTCWCTSNGHAMCTKIACEDIPRDTYFSDEKEFISKSKETYKTGVDHIERHSVCKPGATFFVSCNPCHCNVDGTDFSCTNKPCPLPEDVEVFHELNDIKYSAKPIAKPTGTKKVCVENRMFIMNCNTCWCNEDGTSYFCTRKVCVPELTDKPVIEEGKPEKLRIIERECRPDEVFELDCNMCRCNADGKSFSCTRRACFDEDSKNKTKFRKRAVPQEPPKYCKPGQEFRMDCNKCLCDSVGQDFSCTRIDCRAQVNNNGGTRRKRETVQNVAMECVAGSVFDQGCNMCRCTEDGQHAVCSLKRCAAANQNTTAPASESSFRCNPGEQFKRNCNDCSCSADGKTEYCTLVICDDELAP